MKRIISLASLFIILAAISSDAQLPGDFNCSGAVNGLDMSFFASFMQRNLVDTGTCTWYNGDLNGDSVYHTIADWRQFIRKMSLDTVPLNPPQPFDLDTIAVATVSAEPGEIVNLPIRIAVAEAFFDFMIQIELDTTYLDSWSLTSNPIYHNGHFYWWHMYGPDSLPAGSYQVGSLSLTISDDCPDDITIPITLVGGNYYPSGFSNDSYPTFFIRPVFVDGEVHVTRTAVSEPDLPQEYSFDLKCFPNPFNAQTVISYVLTEAGPVRLDIYNILGEKVVTLASGTQLSGEHKIIWDASAYPSGVYFARMIAGEKNAIAKLILMK